MDISGGHPIQHGLANLTNSSHTKADLIYPLQQLGGGGATVSRASGDRCMPGTIAKEGGTVSVAPVPVSSVTSVGSTMFAACAN